VKMQAKRTVIFLAQFIIRTMSSSPMENMVMELFWAVKAGIIVDAISRRQQTVNLVFIYSVPEGCKAACKSNS